MKVFRFMSKVEFEKYRNSFTLKNNKKHEGRTNSIGFCFLNLEEYKPEEAMHFLSGIATFDVCAVFETNENLNGKLLCGFNDRFKANEYCITEYDKNKMRLIKYSEDIWKQLNPTEEQQKLKWVVV